LRAVWDLVFQGKGKEVEAIVKQPAALPVSGFWRRVGAFAIDGLVLGVVGLIAGAFLFDTLAQLGVYARVIGFVVALAYFGLLNSRLGGGQTLGKRALSIRATTLDGQMLSVPRSLLRYSVLGIPWFLNNAPLPAAVLFSPWGYVVSLIIFGGLLSILYLVIFNRATRRSLHDYAAGSWVVRTDVVTPVASQVPPLWRGHVVAVGVLMLAALVAPAFMERVAHRIPVFAEMMPALDALNREDGVKFADLNVGFSSNGDERHTFTAASLQLARPDIDDEAFAKRMATTIVRVAPTLGQREVVAVDLRYGYDLGFASGWRKHHFQFTPDQLKPEQKPDSPGTPAEQEELHQAARSVAARLDAGEYGEAWDAAASVMQAKMLRAAFVTMMTGGRTPLGAAGARRVVGTGLFEHMDGAPPGHYGVFVIQTDFANVKAVQEKFVFLRVGQEWKLAGYWANTNSGNP
jgi:uncharacterized RDD family membrane protein YckC